jgi:GNAT superfamily N-acetyltransferase
MSISIRKAEPRDVPLILRFIRDLAEYERLLDQVTATEDLIRSALFGGRPVAEALIGEIERHPAGFALFFHNFSTFVGKPGLYVEDVYVDPGYRGRGLGRAFFLHLAGLARQRGCGRMEWAVLDWNEPAIRFYRNLGARPLDDWTIYRLDEAALKAL